MTKLLTGMVAAMGLFALAACNESDNTTTQSVEPDAGEQTAPLEAPAATPAPDQQGDGQSDGTTSQ